MYYIIDDLLPHTPVQLYSTSRCQKPGTRDLSAPGDVVKVVHSIMRFTFELKLERRNHVTIRVIKVMRHGNLLHGDHMHPN